MARPKNPNNRFAFTCKVTGGTVKTNPKQFNAFAAKYGVTPDELDNSYVSRAGRHVIEAEKLTPEQAVEKYGLHPNVASTLKATIKPAPVAVAVVEAVIVNDATSIDTNDSIVCRDVDTIVSETAPVVDETVNA